MKFKTTKSPHEIGVEDQDLVVKFCFAKQTQPELHENMTYWSECRDFMGDAVCAMHDGKEKSIYGFKYNLSYLVTNEEESSSSKFVKAKDLGIPIINETKLMKLIEG